LFVFVRNYILLPKLLFNISYCSSISSPISFLYLVAVPSLLLYPFFILLQFRLFSHVISLSYRNSISSPMPLLYIIVILSLLLCRFFIFFQAFSVRNSLPLFLPQNGRSPKRNKGYAFSLLQTRLQNYNFFLIYARLLLKKIQKPAFFSKIPPFPSIYPPPPSFP